MTNIQLFNQFLQLFDYVTISLNNEFQILQNDSFKTEIYEKNNESYQRGEMKFNQIIENINYLDSIIQEEQRFLNFFSKCKTYRKLYNDQRNKLIDELSNIKKETVTTEEWNQWKEIWDKKRDETDEEKMKRETQELFENILILKQEIENELFKMKDLNDNISIISSNMETIHETNTW